MLPKDWLKQFEEIPEFSWEDSITMYNTLCSIYELAREMANEDNPNGKFYALRIIETMVEDMNAPVYYEKENNETRQEKEE